MSSAFLFHDIEIYRMKIGWTIARGAVLAEPQTAPRANGQPPAQTDTLKSGANIDAEREFQVFCLEIPQRYYCTAFFHLERTINGWGRVIKSVIDVLANSIHKFGKLLTRHFWTFINQFQIFANVGQTYSVIGKP